MNTTITKVPIHATDPLSVSQSVQAQAAENALKGERSFLQISFPIVGDNETNLISAVNAAVGAVGLSAQAAARVLKYLSKRYIATHQHLKEISQPVQVPYDTTLHNQTVWGQDHLGPITARDTFLPPGH